MRFLVTGGAGFIGSHIVERLLKDGHFVRVLDNFSSGKRENVEAAKQAVKQGLSPQEVGHPPIRYGGVPSSVPDLEVFEGDIRDKATCDKACEGIDYISHQAALRSVPKSMKDPESYNDVNIGGTLNLLQSALKNKVKRFVFASSSSVYGDTDKFPEREDAFPLLISPYALSKLANEYYCRIFSSAWGLETVGLRYFNVFGPRQALDDEYAVVIPKFIHCILHDEQPPIFGTGKQSRDFTYIDNVVQANVLAMTQPLHRGLSPKAEKQGLAAKQGLSSEAEKQGLSPSGLSQSNQKGTVPSFSDTTSGSIPAAHEVFNVANGQDNTVLQLVDYLNKIIGQSIKPKFLPVRPGDVFRTCADISKIKSMLGYKDPVGFEEGLKRTVEYFKSINKG